MGGFLQKAIDPLGAIAPKLSPAKMAAKKFNAPFLDPSNAAKPPPQQQVAGVGGAAGQSNILSTKKTSDTLLGT